MLYDPSEADISWDAHTLTDNLPPATVTSSGVYYGLDLSGVIWDWPYVSVDITYQGCDHDIQPAISADTKAYMESEDYAFSFNAANELLTITNTGTGFDQTYSGREDDSGGYIQEMENECWADVSYDAGNQRLVAEFDYVDLGLNDGDTFFCNPGFYVPFDEGPTAVYESSYSTYTDDVYAYAALKGYVGHTLDPLEVVAPIHNTTTEVGYFTIQAAIDDASSGDIISTVSGSYTAAGGTASSGGTATIDVGTGNSELYVDMNTDVSGAFTAVEVTETPSQGFTGMGSNGGIAKSITINTNADDGGFIMLVKFHYTDAELTVSDVSEDDLRLCYWDTANSEWKLAVAGNTVGTATWKGNSEPPTSPTTELGWHGVDQVNNIAWAVVDHCTEYGAGEEPPGEGEFEVNPPTVTVTFTPTSMTPMHEQTVTVGVEVDSTLTLADLTSLEFKVWYDADGSVEWTTDTNEDGIPDEFAGKAADTQTCAVISWVPSTFTLTEMTGTTWSLGSCTTPSLSGTSGNFILNFTPGKVATEADGTNNNWQLAASVASTHGGNGFGYDATASSMDWYGCLMLSDTIAVGWGVVPAGMDFANDLADQTLDATITIISNSVYELKAKAGDWEGASNTASLDSAGNCAMAQQFALKAASDDIYDDSALLDTSGIAIVDGGSATTEEGTAYTSATLWLKLASAFTQDTYSGAITYMIAND